MSAWILAMVGAAGLAAGWGVATWSTTRLERAACREQIAELPPKVIRLESAAVTFEVRITPDLGTEPKVRRQPASAVATVEKEGSDGH